MEDIIHAFMELRSIEIEYVHVYMYVYIHMSVYVLCAGLPGHLGNGVEILNI